MIQDFSNTFDGKQAVMVKSAHFGGSRTLRKAIGAVLVGSMLVGLVSSVSFAFLIRSELNALAVQQTAKIELLKTQQGLYQQRNKLLAKDNIVRRAGRLGLHSPLKRQVRRL